MSKIWSLCLCAALIAPSHLLAQTSDNPVTVKGAGSAPCAEALRVFGPTGSQADRGHYLQWATGLSVGAALANRVVDVSPTGDIADLVQIALLICQEPANVNAIWYTAVSTAIGRLRPYWSQDPTRVIVTHQGKNFWLYKDAVKQLQTDLNKLGYGLEVDGAFGQQTLAAVVAVHERISVSNMPVPTGMLFYGLTRPPQ